MRSAARVDVVVADLDVDDGWPEFREVLTSAELDRAARFRRELHRVRWARGRIVARSVLAERIGCSPREVQWGEEPDGKPFVEGEPGVHFNVSHSGSIYALAVGAAGPLGIDVELVRGISDLDSMIDRVFTDEEKSSLPRAAEGEALLATFFEAWTLKEAVMKYLGTGFRLAPAAIELGSLDRDAPVVRRVDDPTWEAENVHVAVPALGEVEGSWSGSDVAAALVWRAPERGRVVVRRWTP